MRARHWRKEHGVPSLLEQQRLLQAAILMPGELAAALRAECLPRLAIYRDAYSARLAGALRTNFPALAALLGDAAFDDLARRYARDHPSHHPSIRWHGERLADYELGHGALNDLARMEWALGLAFDAPDAPVADAVAMSAIPVARWGALPVTPHPSVQCLDLAWAVEPTWDVLRSGSVAGIPEPTAHCHALLVWRLEHRAHWRIATAAEAEALRRLGAAGSLDALCGEDNPAATPAEQVGAWFACWVRDEMLAMGRR